MSKCEHLDFTASVAVGRLTDGRANDGRITGFMADIKIHCSECKRPFQFLGLESGIDLQGACMSIDGLEAHIAICPQGEQPSPLDRISVNFPTARSH